MNKIEKLIEELCPQGVELMNLGETCEIKTGKGITKKESSDFAQHPIISGGKKPMGFYDKYNRQENTVTISRVGANAGFVSFINTKFYLNDKCFSILPVEKYRDQIKSKFLFYFLKANESYITGLQSEGGVPTINTAKVAKIKIPIPPLTIQKEIVKILDNFTQLEAELEAELEARKKQYEHYREQLLMVNDEGLMGDGTKVEFRALGEVIKSLKTGLNPRKNFILNTDDAKNYYVTVRELGGIRIDFLDKTDKVNDEALGLINNRSNLEAGDILFSGTGTVGRTALIVEDPKNWNIKEGVYTIKPDKNSIHSKFLLYYLNSIHAVGQYEKKIVGSPVISLPMKDFKKIQIPIPPLSKQKEIVAILDKFDALVNDISTGLPAEIAARKKQYEYYRNQLLEFRVKSYEL